MRFFRGISVPASSVEPTILSIRENGLTGEEGRWRMSYNWPGPPDVLFNKKDLSVKDTRASEGEPGVCACGEKSGAAYYAWHHNKGDKDTSPIIIEFEADESVAAVDGRDFLYTVFQLGDPNRARPILERTFGYAVLRYAERAWNEKEQSCRIALCDIAIHDPEVIRAHHANECVLGGRYSTVFKNAFIIRLPVCPEAILSVWSPGTAEQLPLPKFKLPDALPLNR
jgi:hypothetical protein